MKCSSYRTQTKARYEVDNLNNVRLEVSRRFSNKKKDPLKVNIDEHEINSKNNNIRDCIVQGHQ
jgi:hypothetical protein